MTLAAQLGAEVLGREAIPDDQAQIEARLLHWCAAEGCSLILTSGGTGVAPSDVTPEATAAVIEREIGGLAGVRGSTLIVNLPGSPRSIAQIAPALLAALPHAVALIGTPQPR